jgi:hypothetical protein
MATKSYWITIELKATYCVEVKATSIDKAKEKALKLNSSDTLEMEQLKNWEQDIASIEELKE